MATHSSILVWKIPWPEEPGGLQSMGLQSPDMAEHTAQCHWVLCFTVIFFLSSFLLFFLAFLPSF